ncbi:hypothetical protein E2C01_053077 [Portunus trituberculatus]|uniref:Uncharacterized protein n=1 Tax=Portunus trituberculatus TaxID=210409 RepID=A0A5B7GND3_PORTR|nr:hypothetical protein [Portunus trituberculatus]
MVDAGTISTLGPAALAVPARPGLSIAPLVPGSSSSAPLNIGIGSSMSGEAGWGLAGAGPEAEVWMGADWGQTLVKKLLTFV